KRLRKTAKFGIRESYRSVSHEVSHAFKRLTGRARSSRPTFRIAMISDWDAWCSDQQFNPFNEFRSRLADEFDLLFTQMYLDPLGIIPPLSLNVFDAVMIKLSYRTDPQVAISTVQKLKDQIGTKPLIYMDGDDDLCIQWGEIAAISDLYVKCHAFVDRQNYKIAYKGKSNLHDYAIEKHGHVLTGDDYGNPDQPELIIRQSGTVRDEDLSKIVVGWNMALSEDIRKLWRQVIDSPQADKSIDCSFRGSVKVKTITGYMRKNASEHLQNLVDKFDVRVSASHIPLNEYYRELQQSRICVSPFGFGELCWRDFEAVICRSLLIKPDMSHVETLPNIFQPYVTYVPVKWDLSDLEDVCAYYLEHSEEREAIVENAFNVLNDYYSSFQFGSTLVNILSKVRPPEHMGRSS
ncbi:MAG: glycosyltransferase, partial [Sphingomonas sp.]|nr:glycosyltransferase [Sphingomonas sp.]